MIYKFFTSYKLTFILFAILAIGAASGTFIENDLGSIQAKLIVYHSDWYRLALLLSAMNLLAVIFKTKMYKMKALFIFHVAFVVILIGAALTHFWGVDGLMQIREGEGSDIVQVGTENISLPFRVELLDFTLIRYPGSRSPSEFKSELRIVDAANDHRFETQIYMNRILDYGGYRFFQTSYDSDEKGTVLTVNRDPGVEVTYLGYGLLFLGLLLNLFERKSRFRTLLTKVNRASNLFVLFIASFVLFLGFPTFSYAESTYLSDYLDEHRKGSQDLADNFGTLIVQSPDGRMKPLDTQNREVLYKISGKNTWNGMTANQVILGMFSRPALWKKVNLIRTKTPKLRKILGIESKQKLAKFSDFFDIEGNYKLSKEVELANQIRPSARGTFERDLIRVDERLNITFMVYRGVLLTLFPLPNAKNDRWVDFKTIFVGTEEKKVKRSASRLLDAAFNRNYSKGGQYIEDIRAYQVQHSSHILPSSRNLKLETWYNKSDIFFRLSMAYILVGLLLLFWGILSIFSSRAVRLRMHRFHLPVISFLFVIHNLGFAVRWVIGGYAPITNTYETMVYIAYASILVGVLFFRKFELALSASCIMAGIFIFGAYLGEIDPEITSLVPVLKSYWLSIHVSVITASYGFFGVSALLGVITLLLFPLRHANSVKLDQQIRKTAHLIELSLILGLTLLVIGNFLGAIWANESWGRYWGWDPKETWAYISIIVYSAVLHLRLIPKLYSGYLFTVLSVFSFASILMTYFGVNFYLAGMHSYATGDPVPIPAWVYIGLGIVSIIVIIAYPKRKDL